MFAGKPSHIPLISKGPVNTTVEKGQTAEFSCEIHNNSKGVNLLQWVQQHLINSSYTDEHGEPYITIVKVIFNHFIVGGVVVVVVVVVGGGVCVCVHVCVCTHGLTCVCVCVRVHAQMCFEGHVCVCVCVH